MVNQKTIFLQSIYGLVPADVFCFYDLIYIFNNLNYYYYGRLLRYCIKKFMRTRLVLWC